MDCSIPCAAVAAALVAIQNELKDPEKTRDVQAGPKRYSYAELDKALPDIRALCTSHKVFVSQSCVGEDMVTVLLHESGEWVACHCPVTMPSKAGDPQAFGSSITYARRYGLFMALGLVAQNEDNDGKQPESKDRRRETPDAKQTRQDSHHESWTPEVQKRFMGNLKKAGFPDYDEVCRYVFHMQDTAEPNPKPRKKPSEMTSAGRDAILKHLRNKDNGEAYAKWLDFDTNERGV
jgi:hypothetical protein